MCRVSAFVPSPCPHLHRSRGDRRALSPEQMDSAAPHADPQLRCADHTYHPSDRQEGHPTVLKADQGPGTVLSLAGHFLENPAAATYRGVAFIAPMLQSWRKLGAFPTTIFETVYRATMTLQPGCRQTWLDLCSMAVRRSIPAWD